MWGVGCGGVGCGGVGGVEWGVWSGGCEVGGVEWGGGGLDDEVIILTVWRLLRLYLYINMYSWFCICTFTSSGHTHRGIVQ